MRAVVTRVSRARVVVAGEVVGEIGKGLLVLLGVGKEDDGGDAAKLAGKVRHLRIFADSRRPMNRSILDVGGDVLVVSQFTLMGDARKGRRPSFVGAARPEAAEHLYLEFVAALRDAGLGVETGRFGATMEVESTNDGPVTILLSTRPGDRL